MIYLKLVPGLTFVYFQLHTQSCLDGTDWKKCSVRPESGARREQAEKNRRVCNACVVMAEAASGRFVARGRDGTR